MHKKERACVLCGGQMVGIGSRRFCDRCRAAKRVACARRLRELRAKGEGKPIPRRNARAGQGCITPTGYRVFGKRGKQIYEHVMVWEKAHGAVPKGYRIHHINGNRSDNGLSNLMCLSEQHHQRLHRGWVITETGEWLKRCSQCREWQPEAGFRHRNGNRWKGVRSWCRVCESMKAKEGRERRVQAAMEGDDR